MLRYLAEWATQFHSGFNVFSYLTLRAILAALTALAISFVVGPYVIRRLAHHQVGQRVRSEGPQSHLSKAGTPTMGGALILVAIIAGTLLWADLRNRFVWIVLAVTAAFGLIGFWDDYLKLVVGDTRGLIARYKYLWQSVAGLGAALGVIAVVVRQEIVLFIMGGVFVMETVSVILQVASFKLTGKRIFKMAPIHHHYELKGWAEPKVIVRFWIITVVLVLFGLATLKLR